MDAFNETIENLQLVDVPLENRRYTWSNKQPSVIFSRLDRFLLSHSCVPLYPKISLQAPPAVVSDHCPLLLRCSNFPTQKKLKRVETYWLGHKDFASIANGVWNGPQISPDQAFDFSHKLASFHEALSSWDRNTFRRPNLTLLNAKRLIQLLDTIEEQRSLSRLERFLRIKLREIAFHLAVVLEKKWHQRARSRWLQNGDKNTAYFHATASAKKRNKCISSLLANDQLTSDPSQILLAFSSFYESLFSDDSATTPVNLNTLYQLTLNFFP